MREEWIHPLDDALRQLGADILNEPIPESLYRALHATRPSVSLGSFRDRLAFAIGFAISRNHDLLRRLRKEHVTDDARDMLARRVIEHLELCGFTIDESSQMMKRRPPPHGRG